MRYEVMWNSVDSVIHNFQIKAFKLCIPYELFPLLLLCRCRWINSWGPLKRARSIWPFSNCNGRARVHLQSISISVQRFQHIPLTLSKYLSDILSVWNGFEFLTNNDVFVYRLYGWNSVGEPERVKMECVRRTTTTTKMLYFILIMFGIGIWEFIVFVDGSNIHPNSYNHCSKHFCNHGYLSECMCDLNWLRFDLVRC